MKVGSNEELTEPVYSLNYQRPGESTPLAPALLPTKETIEQGRTELSTKREKRRRDEAPMPAASAGLLRFFEEDTPGVKLSPQLVIVSGVGLVAFALIFYFLLPVI